MKSNLVFSDLQLDDDFKELNSKDYTSNSNGISFWINNGIVESISISPNYQKDDETPIYRIKKNDCPTPCIFNC
jgi:hypothetical protein